MRELILALIIAISAGITEGFVSAYTHETVVYVKYQTPTLPSTLQGLPSVKHYSHVVSDEFAKSR